MCSYHNIGLYIPIYRVYIPTIWLSSPLYDNRSYYGRLTYGISILLFNDIAPQYYVYIQQERNGTWTSGAVEINWVTKPTMPLQLSMPLHMERKYTAFSNHRTSYINLSFDLDTIGFPDKYKVYSYVQSLPLVLAEGYSVNVPPTTGEQCGFRCVVPSWPSSILVFAGQTSKIPVPIKSTDFITTRSIYGERYRLYLQDSGFTNYGIKLNFIPSTIETGSNTTFLQITTPSNIASNNYTIFLNEIAVAYNGSLPARLAVYRIPTSFNIEVLKPLNIYEQISQFLTTNIEYTVIMLLGIPIGIALPLLFYVRHDDVFMELHKSDILQINATVMVGVLILLTLGSLKDLNTTIIGLITASIIIPFAVSSVMVTISKDTEKIKSSQLNSIESNPILGEETKSKNLKLFPVSIMLMIGGFLYVIAAVIILALIG
jgi:hypothetical protein